MTSTSATGTGAGNPHPWTTNPNYTPPAQGPVTITASVTNGANTATDTVVYIYDTVAPALSVAATPTLSATPSFTLSGNYSDATSGVKVSTLTLAVCNSDCSTNCQNVPVTGTGTGYSASRPAVPGAGRGRRFPGMPRTSAGCSPGL